MTVFCSCWDVSLKAGSGEAEVVSEQSHEDEQESFPSAVFFVA